MAQFSLSHLSDPTFLLIAGICGFGSALCVFFQILCHLRYYTAPHYQKFIIRILVIVPAYGIASYFSLIYEEYSIWFETLRDCYEAVVIYTFLHLCLAYVGGPGAVETDMKDSELSPSCLSMTCCLPHVKIDGRFVKWCKNGTLQFVLVKPILAAVTLLLYANNLYTEGNWNINNGYVWITIIYNITYTVALYALLLFYLGTHRLLEPFSPLLKFILVKSVVFLTFWQGVLVSVLVGIGVINSVTEGKNLQNFLICVEMLPAAVCMFFAFPYFEYKPKKGASRPGIKMENLKDAINILPDVINDVGHSLYSRYKNYVVHSAEGEHPAEYDDKAESEGGQESVTSNKEGYSDAANLLANMERGFIASPTASEDPDQLPVSQSITYSHGMGGSGLDGGSSRSLEWEAPDSETGVPTNITQDKVHRGPGRESSLTDSHRQTSSKSSFSRRDDSWDAVDFR